MRRFHLSTLVFLTVEAALLLYTLFRLEKWLGKQSQEFWSAFTNSLYPAVLFLLLPVAILVGTGYLLEWYIRRGK